MSTQQPGKLACTMVPYIPFLDAGAFSGLFTVFEVDKIKPNNENHFRKHATYACLQIQLM